MTDGYIIYKCKKCNRIFMLMVSDVKHSELHSTYITCPFDGRDSDLCVVGRIDRYGEIKSCMNRESYERKDGRIKQK